jgi:hypothetical protein
MSLERKDGNLTITIKQIKIKNFEKWSEMRADDLRETKNEFQNRISAHMELVIEAGASISFDRNRSLMVMDQMVG